MNAKQKYLLLLMLFGYITTYNMECVNNTKTHYSDEDTSGSDSDDDVQPRNFIDHTLTEISKVTLFLDTDEHSVREQSQEPEAVLTLTLNHDQISNESIKNESIKEECPLIAKIDTKVDDTKEENRKYDPTTWGTYIRDRSRGFLCNILHELEINHFDEKRIVENTPRVEGAVTEAISSNKPDQLVMLINGLNAKKFPISKTKSKEAMAYLVTASTKMQDKFYLDIMNTINKYNVLFDNKEAEITKNILPLLTAALVQLKEITAAVENDENNTVKVLNHYRNAINTLVCNNYLDTEYSISDQYTVSGLLDATSTKLPIQTLLEKHKVLYEKLNTVHGLLEKK